MQPPGEQSLKVEAAPRQWGRHVFGLGAIWFGGVDLVWRQSGSWQQIEPLKHLPASAVLALFLLVAAAELAGGVAIQWPQPNAPVVRAGALALTVVYLVVTLLTFPDIVRSPAAFNSWGNLGEELSRLAGAVIALAMAQRVGGRSMAAPLERAAYWAFALCVVSFMVEQWVYFPPTVALVPKWIPLGQVFWAVATTAAFGLAAAALLARRAAVPAAQWLTAMLLGFLILVWAPILFEHPQVLTNWTEAAETLSIAGAAWVVADYLARPALAKRLDTR